jgi:hypothetical protein
VLEGELAHLAVDPGLVDRDGLAARPEGGDDRRDRVLVERESSAGEAGAVYSLVVLRLRDQPSDRAAAEIVQCPSPDCRVL